MSDQFLFKRINTPGVGRAIVATASVQATIDDKFLQIDVAAGSQSAYPPPAEQMPGMKLIIQKSDASNYVVPVIPLAPNVINPKNPLLIGQYAATVIISDGRNWNVIGGTR